MRDNVYNMEHSYKDEGFWVLSLYLSQTIILKLLKMRKFGKR
jgi:hypothetical protein